MSEHPPEAIIGGDAHHRAAGPPQAPLDLANVKEGRHDHRVLPARPGIPPDPPVELPEPKPIDPEPQRLPQFPTPPPPPRPLPPTSRGRGARVPPPPPPARRGKTNVPRPRSQDRCPSRARSAKTREAVFRLMRSEPASCRTVGSRRPGNHSPAWIRWASCAFSWMWIGSGLFRFSLRCIGVILLSYDNRTYSLFPSSKESPRANGAMERSGRRRKEGAGTPATGPSRSRWECPRRS